MGERRWGDRQVPWAIAQFLATLQGSGFREAGIGGQVKPRASRAKRFRRRTSVLRLCRRSQDQRKSGYYECFLHLTARYLHDISTWQGNGRVACWFPCARV